jgi:hypothetical protein
VSRPTTRTELLARIDSDFASLMLEVDRVPPDLRCDEGACGAWSVKDLLAHLDGWHELVLSWERAGRAGEPVAIPAPGLTWAQLPVLNDQIWQRTRADAWDEVRARLDASHAAIRAVVSDYSEDDLFTKRRFPWTGSTSVGSYAVSATTSHYDWARTLIRRFVRTH